MKNLPYIIIVILIGVSVYFYIGRDKSDEIAKHKDRIDSLTVLIEKDKLTIKNLLKDAKTQNIEQNKFIKKADSLSLIISEMDIETDCPKIVKTQEAEISNLRSGLKECNKVKAIQVKTITKYADVVIKHELIALETSNLQKYYKKDCQKGKFKAFISGLGIGGVIVLIVLL